MDNQEQKILLIGASKMGKTHFGGQLYGRLKYSDGEYVVKSPPDDIKLFEEVLQKLHSGVLAEHTSAQIHKIITLNVQGKNGKNTVISIPDYGGEQVTQIVYARGLDEIWHQQIIESNSWMLIIRPKLISVIEDITNKTFQEPGQLKKEDVIADLKISDPSFYIELMQILLYTKGKSILSPIESPKLIIVLSCWDEPGVNQDILPMELLKERMPLFYTFIESNWSKDAFKVIGLSALGKELSNDKPDSDYLGSSPENFGFLILPDGAKDNDLTKVITLFQSS